MTVLHAELAQRVAVDTAAMPWTAHDGIEEKLLEHAPGPRGLLRTALLRLPPAAHVPVPDVAGGSLDVFVLEGDLRDGALVHARGAYVHAPSDRGLVTDGGCTLFVKQRPAHRTARAVVDTRYIVFERSYTAGLWEAPLFSDPAGRVVLLRFDPGAKVAHHHHRDGEEFFVLAGELRDDFGRYPAHAWTRQPPDSSHAVESVQGAMMLTFAHHLQNVRSP